LSTDKEEISQIIGSGESIRFEFFSLQEFIKSPEVKKIGSDIWQLVDK